MEEAQSLSVKRAEVEWHNFAALGEPERVFAAYTQQNLNRGALIRAHLPFLRELTPFLEIGACAGQTSYLLANSFAADGFALDISADALRWGVELMSQWNLRRAPVRAAGDALHLPFRDGSLRVVLAYQMLSQFMDIEAVFLEVKRVLAAGGVFLFGEEPLRRAATLRLYRAPYERQMTAWERKLNDWGLLGYLVRDVIGAHQEESFGIKQNHRMTLKDWDNLVRKHFSEHQYEIQVPGRGWGERWLKRLARKLDPAGSDWRGARLLGGTLTAFCRKAGNEWIPFDEREFESVLKCPDCGGALSRDAEETLSCACGYTAEKVGGVYNLLPSAERRELYPDDRPDILDMSRPAHAAQLGEGWHDLEGVYGNKYRWIGKRATARLDRVASGPQRLRIRGFAPGLAKVTASVNGTRVREMKVDRPGLFVLEADVPDASSYELEILASPVIQSQSGDDRELTVNLSMIRLVPRD
jgi:ubiquinone/menaquinone biosynthesis C-methylase UbiE